MRVASGRAVQLGPDHQSRSVLAGYDQQREDELLDAARWTEDGYALVRADQRGLLLPHAS